MLNVSTPNVNLLTLYLEVDRYVWSSAIFIHTTVHTIVNNINDFMPKEFAESRTKL